MPGRYQLARRARQSPCRRRIRSQFSHSERRTGFGPIGFGPTGFGPTGFGPTGFGPTGFGPHRAFIRTAGAARQPGNSALHPGLAIRE
ncbi:hypothetical protein DZK25_10330 [Wenzhouxiangella sp. 15181]|nr:hypothetical protein DZK25_10330 [Wenzhouxiangella sp. 15181]RFP69501.1 hypothetical protein DZK26_03820 [Wenzhouxiangella sp. 15190]